MGFVANHVPNAYRSLRNSANAGESGAGFTTDTALRLNFPGLSDHSVATEIVIKRKWGSVYCSIDAQTSLPVSLSPSHLPSSSDSKTSSATGCTTSSAKETDEESSMDLELDFSLHLGSEKTSSNKKEATIYKPLMADLELSLFSVPAESDVTAVHHSPLTVCSDSHINGGSMSMSSYLEKNPASSVVTVPTSSVTCSSRITEAHQQQQRISSAKTCKFEGCGKGARDASGLCIAHGGGWRCQKPGCHKGAEGRTAYCKAHGGGRRSRGKYGLCIRHGGGKRCQKENCTKSAEGLSGLCISHGGGHRCQFLACTKGCAKGAEGSTPFSKGHGGGKRCTYEGGGVCLTSVHGGTLFCVAHGGGKICTIPDCTRSARGRTNCCVRHGDGKRCQFGGCGKSAQGSTDFCKAHGGGRRCLWGQSGSEYGIDDRICNAFARGKTGFCISHGALVQDKRVHGGATLGILLQETTPTRPQKTKEMLFPPHMAPNATPPGYTASPLGFDHRNLVAGSRSSRGAEGRVHGGSLTHFLAA
ncbi:hypothetical protein R6Q57_007237 [Mikania cordata]